MHPAQEFPRDEGRCIMSKSIEMQQAPYLASTTQYDVVIVGAGPYGLATAAHLSAQGLNTLVLGKPMQLWRETMPEGMLLRSFWWATNISDPKKQYGLEQFCQLTSQPVLDPMTRKTIIDYGLWFYQQAIPNSEQIYVKTIEHQESQFRSRAQGHITGGDKGVRLTANAKRHGHPHHDGNGGYRIMSSPKSQIVPINELTAESGK